MPSELYRKFGFMFSLLLFCASVSCLGCGGAAKSPVQGKVSVEGQALNNGTLTFKPLGKEKGTEYRPAIGNINSDGSYQLSTEALNDGAIHGKYTILYTPVVEWEAPTFDGTGTPPAPPKSPYEGLKPKVDEVEVKAGLNQIDIELVK
jgi:hypothetical protein